jgi:hypothetical protein
MIDIARFICPNGGRGILPGAGSDNIPDYRVVFAWHLVCQALEFRG